MIRVLIADDHSLVRDHLQQRLGRESDLEVVGAVADGCAAVEATREHQPDVVVMDISVPRMNGIDATRQVCEEFPNLKVIGYSTSQDQIEERELRDAGAAGFVSKMEPMAALITAIREV